MLNNLYCFYFLIQRLEHIKHLLTAYEWQYIYTHAGTTAKAGYGQTAHTYPMVKSVKGLQMRIEEL